MSVYMYKEDIYPAERNLKFISLSEVKQYIFHEYDTCILWTVGIL